MAIQLHDTFSVYPNSINQCRYNEEGTDIYTQKWWTTMNSYDPQPLIKLQQVIAADNWYPFS